MHEKQKVKAVYISDLHLGSRFSKCRALLTFLAKYDPEELYLVGDIIDGYEIKKNVYWTECYTLFMQHMVSFSKKNDIIYTPGNHDEFLHLFNSNCFNKFCFSEHAIVERKDGLKILVLHGDQFENHVKIHSFLYWFGSFFYSKILCLDHFMCKWGMSCGIAKWLKQKSKSILNYISSFETKAAEFAKEKDCNLIIAGHIHTPGVKRLDGCTYINCGDWVENCTAIVEDYNGNFEIKNAANETLAVWRA